MAVIGAARSALVVGRDPGDEDRRVIAQSKSSLGPLARSLAFRPTPERDGIRITWLGPSKYTAEQLFSATRSDERPALHDAIYVLFSILGAGPVLATDALSVARRAGVADRTLRRAKKLLGVRSRRVGFGPESVFLWDLPEDDELVKRLRANELDDLVDRLTGGDGSDEEDPADWWKHGGSEPGWQGD